MNSGSVREGVEVVGDRVESLAKREVATLEKQRFFSDVKPNSIVGIDPEIMSGTPCFTGTRVPARALFDYLEAGDSLDEFLEDYPTVTRKQAVAFIETAGKHLLDSLVVTS